ncbi:kinase-like domain-containing protein [Stachybotrys elegans]|uniref:dual-specificity kinase n=1 Tax=Stachybotrys elegans TaxID=80388 RepID=A0A8K0T4Y4_9HYPO|nr:kinase-like domain-containing protein [Stachybotrys elegans]
MSTPTTAVATLPPYNPHQHHYHPSYSHTHTHSHHQPHQSVSSNPNYRSGASGFILPPATASSSSPAGRLLGPYYQSAAVGYPSAADAVAQSSVPRPPPHEQPLQATHNDRTNYHSYAEATSQDDASSTTQVSGDGSDRHLSKKRRRSREPDWDNFYRNGLPKEIIVIDDTPEPEANIKRRLANATNPPIVNGPTASQPAKKRRREDEATADRRFGYHVQYVGSHANTPHNNTTPNGTTVSSSDRTNSTRHDTAPTSLSSAGRDEVQVPQKRKRTRQQVANEAKRRDVDGFGDPFFTYKPPPYPPKKAADVHVRVVHDENYNRSVKVDDDDGHYIVVPDADLTDKYQIVKLLGQGTFGKVVQARDRKRNKAVAVKIIRSVQKYRDASKIELRVLATLKANDEENRNRCIHLRDCFDYRGHICIVMDLLGQSVFDFLKGNGFVPFPNSQIQNFARQLLTSVAFLHDLNLIHTDLKPENILLCDNAYQTFTYNRKIPSSSTTINRQATQRRVLLDTEIQLIDFGSATFQDEYHSSVVSTRHYRAPEIILGLGWSFPCDIWSIGCILVEFFTGDALFQTHDNLEHLAMMEAVVGSRIDPHLVQAVNKMSTRSGGNPASKYFKRLKLDYPTPDTTRGSRRFVKAMKHLEDIIPSSNQFLRNFLDLLKKIFVYDPAQRITAKQALNHPWFKEMAHPDDGTEAAKIRKERQRRDEITRLAHP